MTTGFVRCAASQIRTVVNNASVVKIPGQPTSYQVSGTRDGDSQRDISYLIILVSYLMNTMKIQKNVADATKEKNDDPPTLNDPEVEK